MEQTECSETSAYTIQTPGNYPEESTQYSTKVIKLYTLSRQNTEAWLRDNFLKFGVSPKFTKYNIHIVRSF